MSGDAAIQAAFSARAGEGEIFGVIPEHHSQL